METRMEAEVAVVRLKSMLDHGSIASGSHGRLYSAPLDPHAFAVAKPTPLNRP